MPTVSSFTEGNMGHGANRESCPDPARSETLCMSGSSLHRNWEILSVPGAARSGGAGKATSRKPAIYADEKSHTSIVPMKLPNKGEVFPAEVVEGRDVAKGNAEQSPASRTPSRTDASTGLHSVREAARRNKRAKFTALLHHITPLLLVESFYELRRDAAPGVDEVTWRDYEESLYTRVHELHREIHTGRYRAQPARRVYIEKADGKQRPLGIVCLEDKVVQQAVCKVLGAIYEVDFLGFSYGFRVGRGQHDALDALYMGITGRKVGWILDSDIRAFFDSVSHEWMVKFLEHRIADKRLIRLIRKWLKVGVIEDGRRQATERGTPQGAVISPMLANIYLHYVFDLWAHQWRRKQASGEVIVVRYADDIVLGFQHEEEAKRFRAAMQERLEAYGLTLHPEKTRLIEFGRFAATNRKRKGLGKPETFDFLGFTHCCGKNARGWFELIRLTVKKRMRATLAAIRAVLKRRRHDPVLEVGHWLGQVLRGYYQYFAVPGNLFRLDGFRSEVCRAWRQALRRRGQRRPITWARFQRLARKFIPSVHATHPFPNRRFRVTT